MLKKLLIALLKVENIITSSIKIRRKVLKEYIGDLLSNESQLDSICD